VLLRADQLIE